MKKIRLKSFDYSPGYGDMLGEYHNVSLRRNSEGSWEYVCSDRERHDLPTTVSVYEAASDAVDMFEKFLAKKRVFSLEKRPESDLFCTDYSPWHISVFYEVTRFGKTDDEICNISEYRKYSKRDNALLKEILASFTALRGRKISESAEED